MGSIIEKAIVKDRSGKVRDLVADKYPEQLGFVRRNDLYCLSYLGSGDAYGFFVDLQHEHGNPFIMLQIWNVAKYIVQCLDLAGQVQANFDPISSLIPVDEARSWFEENEVGDWAVMAPYFVVWTAERMGKKARPGELPSLGRTFTVFRWIGPGSGSSAGGDLSASACICCPGMRSSISAWRLMQGPGAQRW